MRSALVLVAIVAALSGLGGQPSSASRSAGAAASHRVSIFVPRGDPGANCARVRPLARTVRGRAVLAATLRALLAGPTAAERRRGYGGWFSAKTAGALRSVRIAAGVAHVDLHDLRRTIPNASSSCGSALLLAQLDRTATQFATVRRAVYSFDGDRGRFYAWLQRGTPPG